MNPFLGNWFLVNRNFSLTGQWPKTYKGHWCWGRPRFDSRASFQLCRSSRPRCRDRCSGFWAGGVGRRSRRCARRRRGWLVGPGEGWERADEAEIFFLSMGHHRPLLVIYSFQVFLHQWILQHNLTINCTFPHLDMIGISQQIGRESWVGVTISSWLYKTERLPSHVGSQGWVDQHGPVSCHMVGWRAWGGHYTCQGLNLAPSHSIHSIHTAPLHCLSYSTALPVPGWWSRNLRERCIDRS